MIRETCSCGASLDFEAPKYATIGEVSKVMREWREGHKCVEPVTLTEVRESGPGLGDVMDRLTFIAEQTALIGRMLAARADKS